MRAEIKLINIQAHYITSKETDLEDVAEDVADDDVEELVITGHVEMTTLSRSKYRPVGSTLAMVNLCEAVDKPPE